MSLFATIENARKVALRDGYNQIIIKDNEGQYSFSRKYNGACPDWYGKIIGEVHFSYATGQTMYISAAEQ